MQASVTHTFEGDRGAKQPWFASAHWDLTWIIAPAFVSAFLVLIFREQMTASQDVPLWVWVTFVLLIDVAHVYATLFRTYLHPTAYAKNQTLLWTIPGACWLVGALLYSVDALLFWRVLAYTAVFHFIRQQFGFVVIYSRKDPAAFIRFNWLNCAVVYAATIYPLLYWHTHLPRNIAWFVAGDFIESMPVICSQVAFYLYAGLAAVYVAKEIVLGVKEQYFNWPRNLLILGTALSWWVGIITLNSDMAFTITNVVSHGVPYMALVWLYHHKDGKEEAIGQGDNRAEPAKSASTDTPAWRTLLLSNAAIFFLFLAFLAYLEEGLWDGLVWREHTQIFLPFLSLPTLTDPAILALLVPLLSLPQSTHYVLDGFIWRVKDRNNIWSA